MFKNKKKFIRHKMGETIIRGKKEFMREKECLREKEKHISFKSKVNLLVM